jgi:hypothetical protein
LNPPPPNCISPSRAFNIRSWSAFIAPIASIRTRGSNCIGDCPKPIPVIPERYGASGSICWPDGWNVGPPICCGPPSLLNHG